jgi:hypothetical protein
MRSASPEGYNVTLETPLLDSRTGVIHMVARAIARPSSERSMKRAERVEASMCRHWPVRPHMVYIAAWIETDTT